MLNFTTIFFYSISGKLKLSNLVTEFTQDKFVIEIEAKESNTQHRTRATVNLWVYEPDQLIKLVVAMPPMQVVREQKSIIKALKNVTQDIVVLDAIKYVILTYELFVTSKNETMNSPIHEFKVLHKGQRVF